MRQFFAKAGSPWLFVLWENWEDCLSYTILSFVNANVTIIKKMFIGYKCKMGYTASVKGKKPLSER